MCAAVDAAADYIKLQPGCIFHSDSEYVPAAVLGLLDLIRGSCPGGCRCWTPPGFLTLTPIDAMSFLGPVGCPLEDNPPTAGSQTPDLLDNHPLVHLDPEEIPATMLRALFEAFRLEVCYDKPANRARCRVTLTDDTANTMHTAINSNTSPHEETTPAAQAAPPVSHAVRVPDGIRTRAAGLKGRYPGPLDDGDAVSQPLTCGNSDRQLRGSPV